MLPRGDLHDVGHEDERLDALTLAAFGEPVDPAIAAHQAGCGQCTTDRQHLARTVALVRNGSAAPVNRHARPPESVWAAVAAELGLPPAAVVATAPTSVPASPPPAAPVGRDLPAERGLAVAPGLPDAPDLPAAPVPGRHRPHRWRGRVLAAAAVAAVVVVGAGVGGYLLGRDRPAAAACPDTRAQLAPLDRGVGGVGSVGGPTGTDLAAGHAVLVCSADGPALRVTTEQLPIGPGYYEVWLYAPRSGAMVAVGTLGTGGTGTFTLPAGMDLRDYPVVDVSAQQFNGNPAHDRSVLQGPLTS